jgi:hypothetical protein
MVRDVAETGARTAREMYGARGWVAHHNTDLWRATAPIDGAQFGLWPMGGAWLCLHLWDRYDYGRDATYLASIYPLLHGAALFFLDTLQTDPGTGHLVTNPSLSPENVHPHGALALRRANDGHADPARPVRPNGRGRDHPRSRRRLRAGGASGARQAAARLHRPAGPAGGMGGRLGCRGA